MWCRPTFIWHDTNVFNKLKNVVVCGFGQSSLNALLTFFYQKNIVICHMEINEDHIILHHLIFFSVFISEEEHEFHDKKR